MTRENNEATHAYIGIGHCGCVQGAIVDTPDQRRPVQSAVRGFLGWGIVERVKLEDARILLCFTSHPKGACPHPDECPAGLKKAKEDEAWHD